MVVRNGTVRGFLIGVNLVDTVSATAAGHLVENIRALANAVIKARPAAAKGRYVRTVHLCSTMGPSVAIDVAALETSA